MPELPEVETIARELRPLVVGSTILGAGYDWPRAIRHPAPEQFIAGVRGRVVEDVSRRAKWLLLALSGEQVLAVQVKMTGRLLVEPRDAPRDPHVHVWFRLDEERELRFRDSRKFGRVGLYRRDEAGRALGADDATELFAHHGPEPLEDAFTVREFRRLLRRRRGRLKSLLLDQGFIAGVGNIYADEALWRARLHPLRRADGLRPPDEARLYRAIRAVLREAVQYRGSTIDDYRAPDGEGEMQHRLAVYGRTRRPCQRCGRPIRRIVVGIRGTHFCSWCQRLPSRERGGTVESILRRAAGRN